MMKTVRAGVAALAFAGLVAQPIAADAGFIFKCLPPPCHTAAAENVGASLGIVWALGFFLCAGMTVGQQDVYAQKHHTTVTGHDRLRGFVSCIIPPLGFARLDHHRQA